MARSRSFIQLNQSKWAFIEAGDRKNPPLVLVHGLMSFADYFNEIIDALKEDYYVVVPDLPGFGFTPALPLNTIQNMTTGLIDFCHTLGIEKATFVGISMGGTLSLSVAAEAPGLVQAIVVQSPLWRSQSLKLGSLERFELSLLLFPGLTQSIVQHTSWLTWIIRVAKWFKPSIGKVLTRKNRLIFEALRRTDVAAMPPLVNSLFNIDLSKKIKNITASSLVITGLQDDLIPTAETIALYDMLHRCETVTIHHLGHDLLLRIPKTLSQIVASFLSAGERYSCHGIEWKLPAGAPA